MGLVGSRFAPRVSLRFFPSTKTTTRLEALSIYKTFRFEFPELSRNEVTVISGFFGKQDNLARYSKSSEISVPFDFRFPYEISRNFRLNFGSLFKYSTIFRSFCKTFPPLFRNVCENKPNKTYGLVLLAFPLSHTYRTYLFFLFATAHSCLVTFHAQGALSLIRCKPVELNENSYRQAECNQTSFSILSARQERYHNPYIRSI